MHAREPTRSDAERLLEAVAYVNAYSLGSASNNFPELAVLLKSEEHPMATTLALTQLCWLLLERLEDDEHDREEVLRQLAERFVTHTPSG